MVIAIRNHKFLINYIQIKKPIHRKILFKIIIQAMFKNLDKVQQKKRKKLIKVKKILSK